MEYQDVTTLPQPSPVVLRGSVTTVLRVSSLARPFPYLPQSFLNTQAEKLSSSEFIQPELADFHGPQEESLSPRR